MFHHAEVFLESGGMFGDSAKSALGRPNLEEWELFTRETLQNSWDARDTRRTDDGVSFSIDYVDFTGHRADLVKNLFRGKTKGLKALSRLVQSPVGNIPVLIVSDRGTLGLQGGTSAAVTDTKNPREDFVSFIRNIGRPSSKEMKGGTYGFGKAVFFNMSEVNTVLVYTRTLDENLKPISRFIAMANSESFIHDSIRYSGRHWWGLKEIGRTGNEFAEPLTGSDADALARELYMDKSFTHDQPFGTTVAMLAPRSSGESIDDDLQKIAHSLTKWAWPHMVHSSEDLDPITLSVTRDGSHIEIPSPQTDPYLSPFVKAYETALKNPEPTTREDFQSDFAVQGKRKWVDVLSERPIEYLGRLALFPAQNSVVPAPTVLNHEMTHHIALIRNPRMVVNYLPGPLPDGDNSYAGVFIAAKHLDQIFAKSEPPAHDEWNHQTVDYRDPAFKMLDGRLRTRNPVRKALDEIKALIRKETNPNLSAESQEDSSELTTIANSLGGIFSGAAGSDLRVKDLSPSAKTKPSVRKRSGISTAVDLHDLVAVNSGTIALFKIQVDADSADLVNGVSVDVEVYPLLEGKRVKDTNEDLPPIKKLGWVQSHELSTNWPQKLLTAESTGPLQMRSDHWMGYFAALQPRDTAIEAEVVVTREED